MAKCPWDPFPLPLVGDHSDEILFEAIGKTLNRWEYIEVGLAIMYSLFVGDPTFEKMREYGEGKIFRDRQTKLQHAANGWFTKHPDQSNEGAFDRLMTAASGFADRRNEFAHGVVMDVQTFEFWKSKLHLRKPNAPQFLVIPALHVIRKHDASGMPKFGYSSQQLTVLHDRMVHLELAVDDFKARLWPNRWRPAE